MEMEEGEGGPICVGLVAQKCTGILGGLGVPLESSELSELVLTAVLLHQRVSMVLDLCGL
jgi:hypothetical protein